MVRVLPLVVAAAFAFAALATGVSRLAGQRWAWVGCGAVVLAVALLGASRVGTANPFSRTARLDPLLFFVMVVALLGLPAVAATYASVSADAGASFLRATLWSALLFLLASPVGFVAAVVVEVLWPH